MKKFSSMKCRIWTIGSRYHQMRFGLMKRLQALPGGTRCLKMTGCRWQIDTTVYHYLRRIYICFLCILIPCRLQNWINKLKILLPAAEKHSWLFQPQQTLFRESYALTNAQITGEMELDVSANELYSCTLDRYTKLSINRCNYFTSLIKRLQYSFKNYDLNITCNLGTLFFRVRNKISSRIFTENWIILYHQKNHHGSRIGVISINENPTRLNGLKMD